MIVRRLLFPKHLLGKLAVAIATILLLLAVLFFLASTAAAQRLRDAWADSDELGLPRSFEELLGPEIVDDQNAYFPLSKAAKLVSDMRASVHIKIGKTDATLSGIVITDMTAELAVANEEYESSLVQADTLKHYRLPVDNNLPNFISINGPHLKTNLATTEAGIARKWAKLGRREEAVGRLLRIGRLFLTAQKNEPYASAAISNCAALGTIVRELNSILRQGPLSLAQHDQVEPMAAQFEGMPQQTRLVIHCSKIFLQADMLAVSAGHWTYRLQPIRDNDAACMIRRYNLMIESTELPYTEDKKLIDDWDRNHFSKYTGIFTLLTPSSRILIPNSFIIRQASENLLVYSRCLRIVNAMARRRDFEADLNALDLPSEAFIDPYSCLPMKLKRTPTGPIIYSVSSDLTDDNGVFERKGGNTSDIGLKPNGD